MRGFCWRREVFMEFCIGTTVRDTPGFWHGFLREWMGDAGKLGIITMIEDHYWPEM